MARSRTAKSRILAQIRGARDQDARDRKSGRRAITATYDVQSGRVMVELTNGFLFGFPAKAVPALGNASPDELATVRISPGGSGLHWEALDVDLSVPGLLLSSVDRSEKLSELARVAGQARTPAKAAAARVNGVKGGRPRKAANR
ncbi:MAG: DUF2442 domain-containing protein [Gemmatimonadaceae bacterium]